MKFIHLADAHLDSPFRGLSFLPNREYAAIQQAAAESLTRIVDLALKEQVDLVLIAGDSFDSNKPSPASQLFLAGQVKRLTDAAIQVVMIFGNHDYMTSQDLLVEKSPYFCLLGDQEQVERVFFKTKTGFAYNVTGFSYSHNHIERDLLPDFPEKDGYTIGLMHAAQKAASGNVYAPFELSELKELGYDYFALGHIHARQLLSEQPLIVYPGNIQGRDVGELGEKGCCLGEVDERTGKTSLRFVPTAPITWKQQTLSLEQPLSKSDLQERAVESLRAAGAGKTYFSLKILGSEYLTSEELDLWQDQTAWSALAAALAPSQLVDVRLAVRGLVSLNNSDRAALEEAEKEVLSDENLQRLAASWIKKDPYARQLLEDESFRDQVRDLVAVKLASRLQGMSEGEE
ncbi:phosphoesterase [Lactobacillus nasalidis]|uniref:Phosphoesterase n=1 Tax=Lactobacillus nasalidis TaxID=2797258 RepID=A0ABQ3W924_9LACO|nr:DNA repair exonuclease [Lactobacillus nasalidis]GHV97109.1 phosphoesterase [Lactobacillus nasalidis]GHV98818.1 phosphoesterase [Lactobacillus nasalidis]GHW02016.1 phosphoesterase [Lactobacillus nasalidis]